MKSFGKKSDDAEYAHVPASETPEPSPDVCKIWYSQEQAGKSFEHSAEEDSLPWIGDALREIEAIMRERHEKYGPGNIAQFGDYGVMVRLADKLARLQHSSGKDYADEATRDAWLDVIGYGLIGLAWVDGNWPGSEKA